jgi:hypothetical protein
VAFPAANGRKDSRKPLYFRQRPVFWLPPHRRAVVAMHRHPHVLNASSNLLGICFVIIGALKFTKSDAGSFADETAWVAALMFLVSITASYIAIRNGNANKWKNIVADVAFFCGLLALSLSVFILAFT